VGSPAHINFHPIFPVGCIVLALYPDTSCFYRADVISIPRAEKASDWFVSFTQSNPAYRIHPISIRQHTKLNLKTMMTCCIRYRHFGLSNTPNISCDFSPHVLIWGRTHFGLGLHRYLLTSIYYPICNLSKNYMFIRRMALFDVAWQEY